MSGAASVPIPAHPVRLVFRNGPGASEKGLAEGGASVARKNGLFRGFGLESKAFQVYINW